MRENENGVERGQVVDRILADAQHILVINGRPIAALEQHDAKGEGLGLHMRTGVEPLHPVDRGNARVVQAWSVDQIEVLQLVADGILRDPFD